MFCIYKLAKILKDNIASGDRCLLVSENRPEGLISDIAVMLAGGITVPAYTTYTEKDYKYLIEDCNPSVIIVSNNEMHDKLQNIIEEKTFIRKVITLFIKSFSSIMFFSLSCISLLETIIIEG